MALSRYNDSHPLSLFEDDFFDSALKRFFELPNMNLTNMRSFPLISEEVRGNDLYLSAELPGLKPEEVTIEFDKGYLTISGEKKDEYHSEKGKYRRSERRYGQFKRSMYVGEVNQDTIKATFKNGVLEVYIPNAISEKKPNKISIEYIK